MTGTTMTAAQIFNAAVAAPAIGAAWETGALDELRAHGRIDVRQFAAERALERGATLAMFRALASVDVVIRSGDVITAGALFDDVFRTRAFFHWLTQGSGELFRRMPAVLPDANRTGEFYTRDAVAISYACREINANFFDPVFWQAVEGLDVPFGAVADLGSGSGQRLLELLKRYPHVHGLGLDIALSTVEHSRVRLTQEGYGDRVTLLEADVRALTPRPEFQGVELLTCFMMGHDFWPREQCVAVLRRLRDAFPSVRRFLLGDTARTRDTPDRELPMFTLGFEVGHALMGVPIPTLDQWHAVFADGGWRCRRTYALSMPAASAIFELEPVRSA